MVKGGGTSSVPDRDNLRVFNSVSLWEGSTSVFLLSGSWEPGDQKTLCPPSSLGDQVG